MGDNKKVVMSKEDELAQKLGLLFALFDYIRIQGSIYGYKRYKYLYLLAKDYITVKRGDHTYKFNANLIKDIMRQRDWETTYLSSLLNGNWVKTKAKTLVSATEPTLNLCGSKFTNNATYLINMCYEFFMLGIDDKSFMYKICPYITHLNNCVRVINENLLKKNKYLDHRYEIAIYYRFYHAYYSWLIKEYSISKSMRGATYREIFEPSEGTIDYVINKMKDIVELSKDDMNGIINGEFDINEISCAMKDIKNKYISSNSEFASLIGKMPEMVFPETYFDDNDKYTVSLDVMAPKIKQIGNTMFELDDKWTIVDGLCLFLRLIRWNYKDSEFCKELLEKYNTGDICIWDNTAAVSRSSKVLLRNCTKYKKSKFEPTVINDTQQSIDYDVTSDDEVPITRSIIGEAINTNRLLYTKRYYLTLMINMDQIEFNSVQYSATISDSNENMIVFGVLDATIYTDRLVVNYWNMDVDNDSINSIVDDIIDTYYFNVEEKKEFTVSANVIFKSYRQQITKIIHKTFDPVTECGGDVISNNEEGC